MPPSAAGQRRLQSRQRFMHTQSSSSSTHGTHAHGAGAAHCGCSRGGGGGEEGCRTHVLHASGAASEGKRREPRNRSSDPSGHCPTLLLNALQFRGGCAGSCQDESQLTHYVKTRYICSPSPPPVQLSRHAWRRTHADSHISADRSVPCESASTPAQPRAPRARIRPGCRL